MPTILVISRDPSLCTAWTEAARAAGFVVRAVPELLPAIDVLARQRIDGILIDARDDDDLALLAMVSAYRPMPPAMVVSDSRTPVATRIRAGALRPSRSPAPRLVDRLGCMMHASELSTQTNLPIRLASVALKWTSRVTASDDSDLRAAFDGETSPDGWDADRLGGYASAV